MPPGIRDDNARIAPGRNHVWGGHILQTLQILSVHSKVAAYPALQAAIEILHSDVQQVDNVVFAQVDVDGI